MTRRSGARLAVGLIVVAVACSACAASVGPADSTAVPATTVVPSPSPTPVAAGAGASSIAPRTPPDATLRVDGGDPVAGQLGTYTWGEAGSDAPFLPGSPITIGAGEPLTVALVEPATITTWRARAAAPGTDPGAARTLGMGAGTPAFAAPEAGSWTIELVVTFADPPGKASYFWAATVR